MTTTATAPQAAPTDWEDFVFTQPSLPLELRAEFFVSAPQGTLVEVDGDLYQFNFAGLWVALGEVVTESNFGSPYATHERSPRTACADSGCADSSQRIA